MLRNKNIDPVSVKNATYKPDLKHLTVIGFVNKSSNTDLAKNGVAKLKKAKVNITDAGNDLSGALKLTVEQFKVDSVHKINETEHKIADFKRKIASSNDEITAIYQHQVEKLEASKIKLISALDEFKEEGERKWETFKHQFGKDFEEFEKEISGFVKNFGNHKS